MTVRNLKDLSGKGAPDLTASDCHSINGKALSEVASGSKVLAIISDKTSDENTDLILPTAAKILAERNISEFVALVAQGTHSPLTKEKKLAKIGAKTIAGIITKMMPTH